MSQDDGSGGERLGPGVDEDAVMRESMTSEAARPRMRRLAPLLDP